MGRDGRGRAVRGAVRGVRGPAAGIARGGAGAAPLPVPGPVLPGVGAVAGERAGVLQARASDAESYVSIECQFANAGGESFLGEYYVYADFDKLDVDYFKARNGYVVVDKMDLSGY